LNIKTQEEFFLPAGRDDVSADAGTASGHIDDTRMEFKKRLYSLCEMWSQCNTKKEKKKRKNIRAMNISREMEQDTQRYIEEAHLVFQFGAASIILRCGLVHLHRIHSIVDGSTRKEFQRRRIRNHQE